MSIAYRLYSGPIFCRLEMGFADTQEAAQAALVAMRERPDYYTHAAITVDRVEVLTAVNSTGTIEPINNPE